jgi:hypothetical protein
MLAIEIRYDRSLKRYIVQNGPETQDFATREQADQFVIGLQAPEVYGVCLDVTQRWPALEDRMWKAARIYLDGKVSENDDGSYTIKSQATPQRVYLVDPIITCCLHAEYMACPDHQHGQAPAGPGKRNWCKHMVAATLHNKFGPRLPVSLPLMSNFRGKAVKSVATAVAPGYYADGGQVPADLLPHVKAYISALGQPPPNQSALVSWVYK